jgi:hypothetical protein
MTVVVPALENFVSLHREEETIRAKSLEELHKAELIHHGVVLEAAMSALHHFTIAWATDDQDKLIIQLLGIRLFNAAAVALKLFLSGYYQGAAGQLRDALETAFLLDYLRTDAALIAKWRTASSKERRELFRPEVVRNALDKRDGFDSKGRAMHYWRLSSLAAHPNPKGFTLLRSGGDGLAKIGPFFDFKALKALASESAKIVVHAALQFLMHFESRGRDDFATKLNFFDAADQWMRKEAGRPLLNPEALEEMRIDLDKLK